MASAVGTFPAYIVDDVRDWALLSDPGAGPALGSDGGRSIPIPTSFVLATRGSYPWQIAGGGVLGYADKPSYLPGESMNFAISSASSYDVTIWRYDASRPRSDPFTLVASSSTNPAASQPNVVVNKTTKMVLAPWRTTATVTLPVSSPSGIYIARFANSSRGGSFYPFVVRGTRASRLMFVFDALNLQAYNRWGGSSLYNTNFGSPAGIIGQARAYAVSFDRPYAAYDGFGSSLVEGNLEMARWLAQKGYDVTYTTDYDLAVNGAAQPPPKAALIVGHSEYWPVSLRTWFDRHVARGMGLGVFGADAGFWVCAMSANVGRGPRTETCPKNHHAFRLAPVSNPEQKLFGAEYGFVTSTYVPYKLTSYAPGTSLLRGTGLQAGSSLGKIAGGEVDNTHAGDGGDARRIYFAQADNIPAVTAANSVWFGVHNRADAVLRAPSGSGRVFAASTFFWHWGLDPGFASAMGVPAGFDRLNQNIIAWIAR